MPEIPDIEAYIEALKPRALGQTLQQMRIANPFVLRTVDPPPAALSGGRVHDIGRLGKRIVFRVAPAVVDTLSPSARSPAPLFIVIHLMVAGRLRWEKPGANIPRKTGLAAFDFPTGTLVLTEAGSKRRASVHLLRGEEALPSLDPGGIDVLSATTAQFGAALRRKNQTLKRALTDPHVLSGIGNAYSDEILHRAGLSPFKQTGSLKHAEVDRLHAAAREVLGEWTTRLRAEARQGFPDNVTAFRPGMAVHGRFGSACPICGATVQRIVHAENECNYCPGCQTGGRILADRALSRLLKEDWPKAANRRRDQEG